jgi:transposase
MSEQKRSGRPRYPPEVRERAVRMVFEHQSEYPSQWKAIESISAKLSINHETLRQWVWRAETDAGQRPGCRPTSGRGWVSLSARSRSCAGRMRS